MRIIGRKKEQEVLQNCLLSKKAEFLAVYGRRRVGKTFLIKEYFKENFTFYTTGVPELTMKEALKVFHQSLISYGYHEAKQPSDWFDAFEQLKHYLSSDKVPVEPISGKKVVFLDELPWMDTPKSSFKSALDLFWNGWASSKSELFLIVCGSAATWIIDNLLCDTGGFYNRITKQIHVKPFTISECNEYYLANNIVLSHKEIMQSYMIFGGIPYYLDCLDRRLSLAQNVDELVFKETGQLHYEYERLFHSLFRKAKKHLAIIETLASHKGGMLRTQLANVPNIGDGEPLTNALLELEQSGFIRKFQSISSKKQGHIYQLIDPFTLFYLTFLYQKNMSSWISYIDTPGFYTWCGLAFERLCILHVDQIKNILGISGVESSVYAWKSKKNKQGAQIDLLIDRKDDVINVCEIKYASTEYEIDAAYEKELYNKLEVFREETKTKKALRLTFITSSGLKQNAHSGIVVNDISFEEVFL